MRRAVIVGAGSNLGAREASIRAACGLLAARDQISVRATSPLYETDPLGPPQPRYLNAAYRLETNLTPAELLRVLLRTERRLGRHRATRERWGPRSIDLDLLWDEAGSYEAVDLRVPHSELRNRDFALRPLLDVAPELRGALGPALERLESPLRPWVRNAIIDANVSASGFEVEVEADSIAEVCALSVRPLEPSGRPWSTRHLRIEPTAEAFAASVRRMYQTGFTTHFATIGHCSQSEWAASFHGVSLGTGRDADVRLRTTFGSKRDSRACLTVSFERA